MNLSKGFTIVELAVVIAVIGILAAISIVSYRGIQEAAYDSSVQHDLQSLSKQFEEFGVRSSNATYPDSAADLESINPVELNKDAFLTDGITYNLAVCTKSGATEYTIAAISNSKKRYFITNKSGVQEYTGTADWFTGSTNYVAMCESTLSGSTVISYGAGYKSSTTTDPWRPWTNG